MSGWFDWCMGTSSGSSIEARPASVYGDIRVADLYAEPLRRVARANVAAVLRSTESPKWECVAAPDAMYDAQVQDDHRKRFIRQRTKERQLISEHGGCCCHHDEQHVNHDQHHKGAQAVDAPTVLDAADCCGSVTKDVGVPRSNDDARHLAADQGSS